MVADIVHLHGARNLLLEQVALYASQKNTPFVVTPNGTQRRHQSRLKRKWIWDKIFSGTKKAQRWIAVSEAEKKDLVNEHISPQNISVIPNGVDTKEIDLYMNNPTLSKSPPKEKKIGYLGQISHRKGVQDLIKATLMLKNTPINLFIAGNDMGSLETLKKQAHHAPNIHFLGLLQGDARLQFLHNLDLLIYPSKNEAFGLVPFEAILCGTPVVVGDDSGCKEWLSLAGCTHFVPFGQPSELAKIIIQQLETEQSLTTIQEWIRNNLSWSSVAQSTTECYTDILERIS